MFRLTRVRSRLMLSTLCIVLLVFVILGVIAGIISSVFLFQNIRTNYLAVASSLAAALDGTRHARLVSAADLDSADYEYVYNLLHQVHSELPSVNWIFTVNYDHENDTFSYAVGSQLIERPTIWVESHIFELQIQVDDVGLPYILYNQRRYKVGQAIKLDEPASTLMLVSLPHMASYTLYADDVPLLDLLSTTPLQAHTSVGPVDAAHTHVMTTTTLYGDPTDIHFFFSAPGEPVIIPGEPFFNTPLKIALMREVLQTNTPRIDNQIIRSIDGSTLTAYAPIRNDQGMPVGLVVVDIHDTQVRALQWSLFEALGISFIIVLLLAMYGVHWMARSLSHPLERLSAAVAQVSRGDFAVELTVYDQDELGQLTRDFNTMANTIAHQHAALHYQQQSLQQRNLELEQALAENRRLYANLEQLVAERTASLQAALVEVQTAKSQIEQWMSARADAVRMIVHDLNHTLQGIQSALDVWLLELCEHYTDRGVITTGQQRLQAALEQQRLLLRELRDTALLESGTLVLQPDVTDLGELVMRVAAQLQPRFDLAGCTLVVALADDVPPAWCDAARLQRVLYNVIENAFRYTTSFRDDGLVQINVLADGDEVVCMVQDNGRGIAAPDLERLGQKFARLVQGEGHPEGMGLGLNFAIGIMRLSNGSLTLTSPGLGQGTTVTLRLPCAHQPMLLEKNVDQAV